MNIAKKTGKFLIFYSCSAGRSQTRLLERRTSRNVPLPYLFTGFFLRSASIRWHHASNFSVKSTHSLNVYLASVRRLRQMHTANLALMARVSHRRTSSKAYYSVVQCESPLRCRLQGPSETHCPPPPPARNMKQPPQSLV